jgi:hypothetical protein
MAPPTRFLPTITAGTRARRSFNQATIGPWPYQYRTALQVYNRSQATVIVYVHGDEVLRVAPGDLGIFDRDTRIPYYEVDATTSTAPNEVEVIESGGLDESVEAQRPDDDAPQVVG